MSPEAASEMNSGRTRLCGIGGVEVDGIGLPRRGDVGGDPLSKIAMRVDQGEAVAMLQVLKSHRLKKGRLPGAGLEAIRCAPIRV
jgi:hypothetical protein